MIDKYNEILEFYMSKNQTSCGFLAILCLLLLLYVICMLFREREKSRKTLVGIVVVVSLMLVVINCVYVWENGQLQKDITDASYEEYIGLFSYGETSEEDSIITLLDNELRLRYDDIAFLATYDTNLLPDFTGKCYGKVIYSFNSKIVVFVEIIEDVAGE